MYSDVNIPTFFPCQTPEPINFPVFTRNKQNDDGRSRQNTHKKRNFGYNYRGQSKYSYFYVIQVKNRSRENPITAYIKKRHLQHDSWEMLIYRIINSVITNDEGSKSTTAVRFLLFLWNVCRSIEKEFVLLEHLFLFNCFRGKKNQAKLHVVSRGLRIATKSQNCIINLLPG